jgi:GAF domain-containing protein
MSPAIADSALRTCARLTAAISSARELDQIYDAALDALSSGLGVERASILLFDRDEVMRFKAYRGLSEGYRRAVEGHTPWRPDSPDPTARSSSPTSATTRRWRPTGRCSRPRASPRWRSFRW